MIFKGLKSGIVVAVQIVTDSDMHILCDVVFNNSKNAKIFMDSLTENNDCFVFKVYKCKSTERIIDRHPKETAAHILSTIKSKEIKSNEN